MTKIKVTAFRRGEAPRVLEPLFEDGSFAYFCSTYVRLAVLENRPFSYEDGILYISSGKDNSLTLAYKEL